MKIFVARLNPGTTSESLQTLFEQYGEVASSKLIMDRETGRSKCYAFIEMPDEEQARAALQGLNGVEFEGNVIAIKEAIPHEQYKRNAMGGGEQRRFGGNNGGYRPRNNYGGDRRDYNGGGGYRQNRGGGYGNRNRYNQQNSQGRDFYPNIDNF